MHASHLVKTEMHAELILWILAHRKTIRKSNSLSVLAKQLFIIGISLAFWFLLFLSICSIQHEMDS